MKICIVSDSHDRAEALAQAVQDAAAAGATVVVHCGDVIGAHTLHKAMKAGLPLHVIHGNNLGDPQAMHSLARESGGKLKLGASAAGDEHRGRCGGGVPGTAVFGTKGCITGLLAENLDRKAVAKALRARHTWATTGERTVGLTRCGKHMQGDEFAHQGPAEISYRFLGDAGWDVIQAWDHEGLFWERDLQKELGYSVRRIRLRWGGARIKDRYRSADWKGTITVTNAVINGFEGRGFEHLEESCWRQSATQIGFRTGTYGDADAIEIDVSQLAAAVIRVEGTIDGYVKVGNPLEGNPFVHCPRFEWEISGAELLAQGRLRKDLPGVEMFLALEHMSDRPMPREAAGALKLETKNGPHGHRPVYFLARQVDDAKVWTSAMFITFTK